MKYPYIVKHNGVWYPAGAEVPDKPAKKAQPVIPAVEAINTERKPRGRKPKDDKSRKR